jgi:hypothetical protein
LKALQVEAKQVDFHLLLNAAHAGPTDSSSILYESFYLYRGIHIFPSHSFPSGQLVHVVCYLEVLSNNLRESSYQGCRIHICQAHLRHLHSQQMGT